MKYAYIIDNNVCEVIPGEDPNFPGIPVTERYAPDFLARCVKVADETAVCSGMIYDPETGTFTEKREQAEEIEMVKITGGGITNIE